MTKAAARQETAPSVGPLIFGAAGSQGLTQVLTDEKRLRLGAELNFIVHLPPSPAEDPDFGEDAGRALSVIMVDLNDTMTAQVEFGHLEFDIDEIVRGLKPRFSRLLR